MTGGSDRGGAAPADRAAPAPAGARFWACAAAGLALVAFGLAGLLRDLSGPQLTSWAAVFLGGLLAHDLVVAPAVALLSLLVARRVPAPVRAPVQAGLVVSALVVAVAVPVVGGWGRLATNPSLLPQDYARNLLVVLACVWLVVAALAWRARRRPRHPHRVRPARSHGRSTYPPLS